MSFIAALNSRSRLSASVLCLGIIACLLVLSAPAAFAAPQGRISAVEVNGQKMSLVFSATGLDAGQSIDPASIVVSQGSTTLPSTAKPIGAAGSQAPTAVLVMDTSGSMAGQRLVSAKAAAQTFLTTVPPSAKIGLVTFGTTAGELIRPTTDRQAVSKAINELTAEGSTALYNGVTVATQAVGTSGPRTIVIFSDGADTSSTTSLLDTKVAVKRSGAIVDAVSLGTEPNQIAALQSLAQSGRGQVISTTDVNQLTSAFSAAARDIGNQVTIEAQIPQELLGTAGNINVVGNAGGVQISDAVFTTIPTAEVTADPNAAGPTPVKQSTSLFSGIWVIALAAILLFGGIAFLLITVLNSASLPKRRQPNVARRLSIYTLTGRGPSDRGARSDTSVSETAKDFANKVMVSREFDSMMGIRLERAGLPLKSGEWLLIHSGLTIGLAILLLLLSGGKLLPAILGVIIGVVAPFLFLTFREDRRKAAFQSQLPDTLQLMAGSIASGLSLPQAIDTLVTDSSPPMSSELRRALAESRLGVQMEKALEDVADRMQSVDFSWVVMAIRIQREVGGNLAEVLTTVAATMRERERLRRQVSTLSAEGRLSAWILGALPVVFTLFLLLTRPEYLAPLFGTPLGLALLIFAGILLAVGIAWLVKTVKVEV